LLTDDFSSIVKTIELGRRIFDNLRKALTYVVAVHMPIAGMALLPLILGYPVAFMPIHIVFFEMIINPACAIVFETEPADPDIMLRKPRHIDEALFGRRNVVFAMLQGGGLLIAVALVFFVSLHSGLLPAAARTLAFSSFVIGNLLLIIGNRSHKHSLIALLRRPNQSQWWVIGVTIVGGLAALNVPVLQQTFHFMPVNAVHLVWAVAAGIGATVWFEIVKKMFNSPQMAKLH
jgi:Ca2+-transporting ATPase